MGDAADIQCILYIIQCAEKRRTRERTKDEDQIRRTVEAYGTAAAHYALCKCALLSLAPLLTFTQCF